MLKADVGDPVVPIEMMKTAAADYRHILDPISDWLMCLFKVE